MQLERKTVSWEQNQQAWQDLSNAMRRSDVSHPFLQAAIGVLKVMLPTVEDRSAFLDQLGQDYFPQGDNRVYFSSLRAQIDIDGPADVFAPLAADTFIKFGVPCNYALVGYVTQHWERLMKEDKIQPT